VEGDALQLHVEHSAVIAEMTDFARKIKTRNEHQNSLA